MTKVGIIGLRPRQVETLREHRYGADLVIFDRDRFNRDTLSSFSSKCDRVIFLHGHTPVTVYRHIPKEKLDVITGGTGVSSVIKFLQDHYPAPEKQIRYSEGPTPPPVKQKEKEPEMSAIQGMTVEATMEDCIDRYLGSLLFSQKEMFYDPMAPAVVIERPEGRKLNDYSMLLAGRPGDTFRYMRESHAKTMTATFSAWRHPALKYSAQLGYELEVHVFKDYVDLHVTSKRYRGFPLTSIKDRALLTSKLNALLVDNTMQRNLGNGVRFADAGAIFNGTGKTEGNNSSNDLETSMHAVESHCTDPTTQVVADKGPVSLSTEEVDFWKQVMVALIADGESVDSAAVHARDAAIELRKLYMRGL